MKTKIISIIAILFFSITIAQTKTHGGKVKIKNTPTAAATDEVVAIQPNGLIVNTGIPVSGLGGGAASLQAVTDVGSTTTNNISSQGRSSVGTRLGGTLVITEGDFDNVYTSFKTTLDIDGEFFNVNGDFYTPNVRVGTPTGIDGRISSALLTLDRDYQLPDKPGTFAMLSDTGVGSLFGYNETGTPSLGTLIVELGDVGGVGNGVLLTLNDDQERVFVNGDFQINEGWNIIMPDISSVFRTTFTTNFSTLTADNIVRTPTENGTIALVENIAITNVNGIGQLTPIGKSTIVTPVVGMIFMDSEESNKIKIYNGTAWVEMSTVLD